MKVVVFGSRGWTDGWTICERLMKLPSDTVIVHGASPGGGADALADTEARLLGLTVIPVPIEAQDRAKARAMGRPRFAPLARTVRMFDEHPDVELAIGFWDGESPGSRFTRDEATKRGIPVEIIGRAVTAARP